MQNFRKHFILFILGASCSSYLSPELTQEEGKKARPISARLQEVIQRLELLRRQGSDSFSNVADLKEQLKDGASGILRAIHEDDEENRLPEDVHRDINSMLKPSMIKLIALTQYAQWEDLAARIKTAEESLESFKKKYEHELARIHGPAHEEIQSDQMHEEPAVENDDAHELKEDNEEHQIMDHEQDADHEDEAIKEHQPDTEETSAEMSEPLADHELVSAEIPESVSIEQAEMSKPVEQAVKPHAEGIPVQVETPRPVEPVVTAPPVEAPKPVEAMRLSTSTPSAISGSVMPGLDMPAGDIAKPLEIPGPSVAAEPAAVKPQAEGIPVQVETPRPVEPVVTAPPVEAPVEPTQLPAPIPSEPVTPSGSESTVTVQESSPTPETVTEEVVDDAAPGDTVPEEPLDMPE